MESSESGVALVTVTSRSSLARLYPAGSSKVSFGTEAFVIDVVSSKICSLLGVALDAPGYPKLSLLKVFSAKGVLATRGVLYS